jgi:hypothetical protein
LEAIAGKHSIDLLQKTRNITHNTASTAVWNLKLVRWRSLLFQEKYREEKACDKRHQQQNNNNNNNNNNITTTTTLDSFYTGLVM